MLLKAAHGMHAPQKMEDNVSVPAYLPNDTQEPVVSSVLAERSAPLCFLSPILQNITLDGVDIRNCDGNAITVVSSEIINIDAGGYHA